jgi:segregation and condensation protein A
VDEEESLALSERDLLIARLLEYRAFKAASAELARLIGESEAFVPRRAGPGEEFANVCPDLMSRVSPERLASIAVQALSPRRDPHVDVSHITPIRVSLEDALIEVSGRLESSTHLSFRDLTAGCRSRIEVVIRFLAVLELIKRGEADALQADTFGDIVVTRLDPDERGIARPIVEEIET